MTRLLLCTGLAAAGLSILGSTYYATVLKSRKDRKHLREKVLSPELVLATSFYSYTFF